MSQFGMQVPGKARRAGGPDVYTALAAVACLCLAAACAVMFVNGSKVGVNGNCFSIQTTGDIKLASDGKAK